MKLKVIYSYYSALFFIFKVSKSNFTSLIVVKYFEYFFMLVSNSYFFTCLIKLFFKFSSLFQHQKSFFKNFKCKNNSQNLQYK